jgi:hypothetical protein
MKIDTYYDYTHTHARARTHTHTHARTHTRTHARTHAHTHACTHTSYILLGMSVTSFFKQTCANRTHFHGSAKGVSKRGFVK